MEPNVDLINGISGAGSGEVAQVLMQANGKLNVGMMRPFMEFDAKTGQYLGTYVETATNPSDPSTYTTRPIQTNGTLRREEWMALDDAVRRIARERLTGIADLEAKGLVYNLNNPMGTTVFEWHDVGDSQEAVMTMDGVTRGQNDRPVFRHNFIPIPIIHVDYEINARQLAASRNMGNALDTYMAENAARRIAEKLEDMLFTDTSYSFGAVDSRGRNTIYSYVNFPDRNVNTFTAWDDPGKTGEQIIADVLAMKQQSMDKHHYGGAGGFNLYIPSNYDTLLDVDYDKTAPTGTTIRERILKIAGINKIQVVDRFTTGQLLLVEMTSDNVRLIKGFGMQNVQWGTEGGFVTKFKVLTIQVPQLRSDQLGQCGIVHWSVT
jgi:hypothetical protein